MKIKKIFVAFAFYAFIGPVCDASEEYDNLMDLEEIKNLDRSNLYDMVKQFVQLEFRGEEAIRYYFAYFTKDSKEIKAIYSHEEECNKIENVVCDATASLMGKILDPDINNLVVVTSYNILSVETDGDRGTAEIDYKRLASTLYAGRMRRMFVDVVDHDIVKMNFVRKNGQWLVVDPPDEWRISINALFIKHKRTKDYKDIPSIDKSPGSFVFKLLDDSKILAYTREKNSQFDEKKWLEESKAIVTERQRLADDKRKWEKEEKELRDAAEKLRVAESQNNNKENKNQVAVQAGNWRDPVTGMEFVWVPGGTFWMGCGTWIPECYADERPLHVVTLDGYWLGRYEVTQGQWQSVMGSNPSRFKKGDHFPVEQVTWHNAQEFIHKLNVQSDGKFRLPSEAEWEYACRSGGFAEKYSGGEDLDAMAWYDNNSEETTHPVGTKIANGLGLFDMIGNVAELVQDGYDGNAYTQHVRHNPLFASNRSRVVKRGGSLHNGSPRLLRCLFRDRIEPDLIKSGQGVRLARSP
ncbi:MAG: SUMF1/EgtB/PvdO family nonheme iron enzyme [Magnetococcus sp. DMHC-1]